MTSEATEIQDARLTEAVREFRERGPSGVHVFRARLKSLVAARDIQSLVSLNWPGGSNVRPME